MHEQPQPIRPIPLEEDREALKLLALQMASYIKEAELLGWNDIPPLKDTLQTLRDSDETFYGYYEGEDLVGAAAFERKDRDTVTVSRMMVHPGHFRKGIASRLLSFVLYLNRDCPTALVSTGTANLPAMMLYGRFGFVPHAVKEIAPGITLTELIRKNA